MVTERQLGDESPAITTKNTPQTCLKKAAYYRGGRKYLRYNYYEKNIYFRDPGSNW